YLRELPRGQPGAVAADAAAAGGQAPVRPAGGFAAVVSRAGAGGRPRPGAGAGGRPRAALGASERGRLPRTGREARHAGDCRGRPFMTRGDMLTGLIAQATRE